MWNSTGQAEKPSTDSEGLHLDKKYFKNCKRLSKDPGTKTEDVTYKLYTDVTLHSAVQRPPKSMLAKCRCCALELHSQPNL